MKRKFSGSLYGTMLMVAILPLAALGIVVALFCAHQYTTAIHNEVETELENVCNLTLAAIDMRYPGDYVLEGDQQKLLRKGDAVLNGDYLIIDEVRKATGIDVTLFYYDTRVLTTILDENGSRIVGTGCNAIVMREVYEAEKPKFYPNIDVKGQHYFCYYKPVYNSDGSCVGMIFAGKPSSEVARAIRYSLIPTLLIIIAVVTISCCICFQWAHGTIVHIQMIQRFLTLMSEGKFSQEMNPAIIKRNDELGKMGAAVVRMQYSFRNLVEKDVLTGLNNRRFGIIKLEETQKQAFATGIPFTVALGDIDFFKKINDTYGHDCGDIVLKEVSTLLRRHMTGKGFAVRWGGEEFLLVYTQHGVEQTVEFVENILREIRELQIPYGEQLISLTMSFGVTQGDTGESADSFIKSADDKLYYAKKHGRNQAVSRLLSDEEAKAEEEKKSAAGEMTAEEVRAEALDAEAQRKEKEGDVDGMEETSL